MKITKQLETEFLKVTIAAAIASYPWIGKNDRHAADDAATKAMRAKFNDIEFDGTVVIGEGERDEAPMLFIGEKLGKGTGLKVDIAVDPLEGTNLCAENKPNAICVFAAAPEGNLFHAPDVYMEKIAVGPKIGNVVSLSKSVEENLDAIAKKTGKELYQITVVVLDRPRHAEIVSRIKAKGANVKLITDGDVFGGVTTAFEICNVDMLLGIGAAPEGTITAVALKILGGYFEGRLKCKDDNEKERAHKMGITDLDKIYNIDELAKGREMTFIATGVTDGDLLKGVRKDENQITTNSLIISSNNKQERARFVEYVY
ncbi:MAG: class II fructose-bisphosphatase [Candidatus Micrarchaeota archaeon]